MDAQLRDKLNAISDVVNNRPKPLREFDQIYMKTADMLLQTEYIGRIFHEKNIIFIGDGDSIGLCLIYLKHKNLIERAPSRIHLIDFDERVILSVQNFAERMSIENKITTELYNVAEPMLNVNINRFDGFYTNPPFGASNNGSSINCFVSRGLEAIKSNGVGCIVLADYPELRWTQEVLFSVQREIIGYGFLISEMIPRFHHYHLDDTPELTSCNMVIKSISFRNETQTSQPLPQQLLNNFYGEEAPLQIKYVRDNTQGHKLVSKDHSMEPLDYGEPK